ncbi:hypothetical protein CBS101457_004553 [Exobasidium rhododendri]|nr:hypothetical protein CBS101457_004553 [Exobasidium rhododendri]
MSDVNDEYERERQENIRNNQELLLSLGLNPSTSRNAIPREKRQRREVKEQDSEERDEYRGRSSARLSARPRRSYTTKETTSQTKAHTTPQRVGSRKSARLSNGTLNSKIIRIEDDDDDDLPHRLPLSTLKRLKNPLPPPQQTVEDYVEEFYQRASVPSRDSNGNIIFENKNRHFMPNVTPEEMIRGGIFGGTSFRPYYSYVLGQQLSSQQDMSEFPSQWFKGLDKGTKLTSSTYDPAVNRYCVKAGQTLEEWEKAGWIRRQDPRGWWQWYFRFYLGRRSSDDPRQIGRFLKACGPSGRFKRSLVSKIHNAGATFDDERISPVVRQTLFHWAYQLTQKDYEAYL